MSKNAVDKNSGSRSTVGLSCSLPQLGCSFRSGSGLAAGDSVNYPSQAMMVFVPSWLLGCL